MRPNHDRGAPCRKLTIRYWSFLIKRAVGILPCSDPLFITVCLKLNTP
jgi:hypothetical protein